MGEGMMLKRLLICLLAIASFCCSLDAAAAENKKEKLKKKNKQSDKNAEIVWEKDIKTALAKAKKSKKYILLIYIAPKVNKSSQLFKQCLIDNKKALLKVAKNLVFVKFEYENLKNVSKEAVNANKIYPIESRSNKLIMPTVYLLDSAGSILEKKVGFQEKSSSEYLKSFKSLKKKK